LEENLPLDAPNAMTRNDPQSSERAVPPRVDIRAQPDEASCGPTCLEAIYRYYRDPVPLESVIGGIQHLPEGGTLAVFLACHALARGYRATIYTCNLHLFDPTWFDDPAVDLSSKLRAQRSKKRDSKLRRATDGYLEFLRRGGQVVIQEIGAPLLRRYFERDVPLIAGLSATFLYRSPRERGDRYDDVRGEASGHFVLLLGAEADGGVRIADPYASNPFGRQNYVVSEERLSGAIYLGVLTYDANLLVIEPGPARQD
jgi:hypothetical protein